MCVIAAGKAKSLICTFAALINFALFSVKLYIAVSSNSISIYVDSLNSLADTLVAAIAVIGFRTALRNPDRKYPFGYGRSEDVVSFLLSLVILFTGLSFVYTSVQRLFYPEPIWYLLKYAVLLALTAAVKLIMAYCFGRADRKYSSAILKNMKIDGILDFFISVCIVISFTLTQKVGYSIDSVTGLAASLIIVISGVKSTFLSLGILVGRSDCEDVSSAKHIFEEAGVSDGIVSVYCHRYGDRKIYNAVINVSLLSQKDLIDKLQTLFKEQLSAEIYFKSGGPDYE